LLAFCTVALTVPPAGSATRERSFDPNLGTISTLPAHSELRDDVLDHPPPALRRATVSATPNVYTAPDGSRVRVTVSDLYAPDPAADQELVNFLASLVHGAELNKLSVFVATPGEIPELCGGIAAACYTPNRNLAVIVGQSSFGGLPTSYVLAHEYGHHIQNHRRNAPFGGGSLRWGTKRWMTVERICPGVLSGRFSLGFAGNDYFRNPREAHAEAYAWLRFPRLIPWEWSASLRPNQRSYNAISADVRRPWRHNVSVVRRGAVSRGGDRRDVVRFATPLDGGLSIFLRGPGGANLDLALLKRSGKRLRASTRSGSREHIGYTVCGVRKFKARVEARRGGGRYRLIVKRP
jgi:hypothetical protein